MKHLLNGVAIAAALVIAAPVWAQAPTTTPAPAAPAEAAPAAAAPPAAEAAPAAESPAPAEKAPMKHAAMKQRHHRPMRRMARRGHMHKMNAGDAMTNQLNREELARIQGGPSGPPPSGATPFVKGQ